MPALQYPVPAYTALASRLHPLSRSQVLGPATPGGVLRPGGKGFLTGKESFETAGVAKATKLAPTTLLELRASA